MNGYCSECDKQVEFSQRNIVKKSTDDGTVEIYLECPWCEEQAYITSVKPTKAQ